MSFHPWLLRAVIIPLRVHVCCYLWHNSVLVDLVVLSDSCWGSHFSWSTYPVSAFTVINICIEFNVPKWCLSFPVFDDKQRLLLKTNRKDDLCRHFMNNLSCVWGSQHEGHSSPESYRIPREEFFFLRNIYIKNQRLYQSQAMLTLPFYAVDLLQETITFAINICIFRLNIVASSKIQLLFDLKNQERAS